MMRFSACVLFAGCLVSFAGLPAALHAATAAETEIKYLSGTGPEDAVDWDFYVTAGRKARVWSKIKVPSCWETQGFGTYNYGASLLWNDEPFGSEQGLYRHEFTVPAAWQGKTVRLVLEGSMTDTTVWINGQPAGPTHIGAFYRFHYDVSELLKFGDTKSNLIEVTVAKVSANRSVNDAERAADYWVFGGLFRPVRLEALPTQFIDWTAIDADADGGFYAQVNLGVAVESLAEVRAQVLTLDGAPVGAPLSANLAAGQTRAELRGTFAGVKLWTAETPHLYRVRFTLTAVQSTPVASDEAAGETRARPGELRPTHTVTERFGFRTLEVRPNDGVYLNGAKIVLKGINRHCFWPETGRTVSREQSYADARLIKEANMNAVRMSHYPPDKHFLEACDELGLYVLDELAGWQKFYNTATGRRLIGQMIRRDVNHPSILFWDNGNEGGWNTDNDDQFWRWDPQKRPVLHPWGIHSDINTDHYEKYPSTVKLSAGPQIFMPTEFLHGLYDGGIGAGFRDYWDVMGRSPTVAGGFFWVFADEGVVRADENGRIDNAGNNAPDGIVGPHREKEGSFFTIKEIWSPVQMSTTVDEQGRLTSAWDGVIRVENLYAFTNLKQCSFDWRIDSFGGRGDRVVSEAVLGAGTEAGPDVAPGASGTIKLRLAESQRAPDPTKRNVLRVTAKGPGGEALWTSSWQWVETPLVHVPLAKAPKAEVHDEGVDFWVKCGEVEAHFSKVNGSLISLTRGGGTWSFGDGLRIVAYAHKDKAFENHSRTLRRPQMSQQDDPFGGVSVHTRDEEQKIDLTWHVGTDGRVALEYSFEYEGTVDLLGVEIDYPETNVKSKRWFGRGPYRVYRNRLEGGVLGLHEQAYNDPIPGQTYAYPEFKGYFRDCTWLRLETSDGPITIENEENEAGVPFLGLYAPRDGEPSMLAFPKTALAFLHVIPAIGTKFTPPEDSGPQSQPVKVSGVKSGAVVLRFGAN